MNFDTEFETPHDGFYFCGYYDKSPLSKDGRKLLVQRASFDDRMPVSGEILEIGYFDFPDGRSFIKIAETVAWNWQQGCMLQWLGPQHNNQIIFNDIREGRFVSKIIDLETNEESVIDHACYTISCDGKFGLAIDYERYYWYRPGYNYQGIENEGRRKDFDPSDGITRVNLRTGEVKKVVNLLDISQIRPLSSMKDSIHFLEHMMIDSTGENIAFLHRWRLEDEGVYGRLFVANQSTSEIRLVLDSGRVSHFCWRGGKELLCYGGLATPINRLRKNKLLIRTAIRPFMPIYAKIFRGTDFARRNVRGDGYLIIDTETGNFNKIGSNVLTEDGHPTFQPQNPDVFVSDTYPDNACMQKLFLWDVAREKMVLIDELRSRSDIDRTGMRCDLHPKWSYDGNFVSIDTVTNGKRGVRVYRVEIGSRPDSNSENGSSL